MQQNPGFMVLYSFIKDALLSKIGLVKVWWEEREEESRETYYDLTEDEFASLAQAVMESGGAMRIAAHTVHDPQDELEKRRREIGGEKPTGSCYSPSRDAIEVKTSSWRDQIVKLSKGGLLPYYRLAYLLDAPAGALVTIAFRVHSSPIEQYLSQCKLI